MLKNLLVMTLLVSTVAAAPAWAQITQIGSVVITPAQSDEYVIEELVSQYRNKPATYAESLAFLKSQRPYLAERFNKLTLKGPASKVSNPATVAVAAPGAKGGTTTSRTTRPQPAGAVDEPTTASVYDGQAALQNNGVFIALGVLGLAAAAGAGGGGGDEVPGITPGTKEYFETPEYKVNSGLAQINASTRYAAGGQGQNVKIAVLDSGIDLPNDEFASKIDMTNSKSYFLGDPSLQDREGHGTHVAGIAAGAKNNLAAQGVAFASQLVIFRGIGASASPNFYPDSINSAISAGVRVMNNSWGPVKPAPNGTDLISVPITDFASRAQLKTYLESRYGADILAAFDAAKASNLLTVFAAGNSSLSDVSVMAGIPVLMPEYAGHILGVVAVDDTNTIADFSNRCGIAKDTCLAAPGANIEATKLGGSGNNNVVAYSGTSMAAPHVTGAAALLISQWPELDSPTIARLLLDTATDLGAPGVDDFYGHGLLNVANAVKPAGALMVYDGTSVTGPATPLADSAIVTSSAMEGALTAALSAQEMIVGDRYNRGYAMEMDSLLVYGTQGPSVSMMVETLSAATGLRKAGFGDQGRAYGMVREDFRTWYGDAEAVAASAGILDHSTLLDGGTTGQFGISLGSDWDARMTATFSNEGAGRGDAFSVGLYGSGPIRASFGVGQMNEQDQVLGTAFLGATGRDGSALTSFVTVGAGATLGGSLDIDLQAVFGQTDFSQGGLVVGGQNMASSGGRLSLSRPVPGLRGGRIGFNLSMPIVVTEGTLTVDVPVQRAASVNGVASAAVLRSREDIAFQNDVQPVDVGMSFTLPIDDSRDFGLRMDGGYRIVSGAESQPFVGIAFTRRF